MILGTGRKVKPWWQIQNYGTIPYTKINYSGYLSIKKPIPSITEKLLVGVLLAGINNSEK